MKQVRLDASHEPVRAGTAGVKVDRHVKLFFKKKFEVHEAGQSGQSVKFHQEIEILGSGIPSGSGAK